MSIFQSIRAAFGLKNAVSSSQVYRGDSVFTAFAGGDYGPPSEAQAMAVTSIYACVNLISGAIASMPMHIYQRSSDGDLSRDMNNPLWWVLNEEFCPRWSAAAGWSFLTASKLLHGDGFAEILRGPGGVVKGLCPLHPNRVRVVATADGARLVYVVRPDPTILNPTPDSAKERVLDQDDMLHIPGFGFNGLRGMSALRNSLRTSGRLAISAQNFSDQFLQNMARPDFALKTDKNLSAPQFSDLVKMLEERRGAENAGRPMILEGGLDIKVLSMPLEEMQLLETRKFQVEEICRAFGVQPVMIGHMEKASSWGTGIEAMGAGFVRYTLRDHLNTFHNEMNRKFFRTARTCAEFDTTELERGDTKAMFDAVRVGLGRAGEAAFVSVEEGRNLLRLPRKMTGTVPETVEPADPKERKK